MTMTSATMIAQPPIQPVDGPSARVAHENVVPQCVLLQTLVADGRRTTPGRLDLEHAHAASV
jgi:hypothetical protein